MEQLRILLIIPCYNEQGSIVPLLKEIHSCGKNYLTVVIDDGSRDNTYALAKALSPTVKLLKNLGIGGAVQTGFKYARDHQFDFCVQIDGDGQHPPSEVEKLLQAYHTSKHSIVIGSRYITNDTFSSTWSRRTGSAIISRCLNSLFQCKVTDPTSGLRLMDRKAIELFAEHYPHDFPEPISIAWALKSGMTVGEVPVTMRAREHGTSSILGFKPIAYMLRVLGYIVLTRFSRHTYL